MLVIRGRDPDFLSCYHTALLLVLKKLGATLTSHGLSHLQTDELRWSLAQLVWEIQDKLPPHCLLGLAYKSQRNQLIAALIGEIGFSRNLQVIRAPDKSRLVNFNRLYMCYFFTKSYV